MQGLILLAAMSSTGGLFGGHYTRPVRVQSGGNCAASVRYVAAPAVYAQAPTSYAPAAPQASAPAATVSYQSFYSVGSTCATGNCARR